MPHNLKPIFYGDVEVRDKNGLISLTDMWIAADKPSGKHEPKLWKLNSGSDFIAKKYNVRRENVYKTTQGRYGNSWAHWQIALAYAKYLSPELHIVVNSVFKERIEEPIDPELGINRSKERARKAWKAQGKSDKWIAEREQGKYVHGIYVDTL